MLQLQFNLVTSFTHGSCGAQRGTVNRHCWTNWKLEQLSYKAVFSILSKQMIPSHPIVCPGTHLPTRPGQLLGLGSFLCSREESPILLQSWTQMNLAIPKSCWAHTWQLHSLNMNLQVQSSDKVWEAWSTWTLGALPTWHSGILCDTEIFCQVQTTAKP